MKKSKSFGKILLARRKFLMISQSKLASMLGVSCFRISNWERGVSVPKLLTQVGILSTINESLKSFVTLAKENGVLDVPNVSGSFLSYVKPPSVKVLLVALRQPSLPIQYVKPPSDKALVVAAMRDCPRIVKNMIKEYVDMEKHIKVLIGAIKK